MFIGIICASLASKLVQRNSFTSTNKEELIQRCLKERLDWEKHGQNSYRIFVGELKTEVKSPSYSYTEEEITDVA